jgi:hypothetical protein
MWMTELCLGHLFHSTRETEPWFGQLFHNMWMTELCLGHLLHSTRETEPCRGHLFPCMRVTELAAGVRNKHLGALGGLRGARFCVQEKVMEGL